MMRPPMKQKLWYMEVLKGETDRYGNPITTEEPVEFPARVRKKSKGIFERDRQLHDTDYEIDVPAECDVTAKQTVHFITIEGEETSGIVEVIEDSVNLSGDRIYFKVLMVDGT